MFLCRQSCTSIGYQKMFRIIGFLDFNNLDSYDSGMFITKMRGVLTHSGQDDVGLATGYRRLSIIDLLPLGQRRLEKEGYGFMSKSEYKELNYNKFWFLLSFQLWREIWV